MTSRGPRLGLTLRRGVGGEASQHRPTLRGGWGGGLNLAMGGSARRHQKKLFSPPDSRHFCYQANQPSSHPANQQSRRRVNQKRRKTYVSTPGRGGLRYIYIYIYNRSEGFHRTGYFVPACVGSGRWADFESCSRIHACGFRCFCRKV